MRTLMVGLFERAQGTETDRLLYCARIMASWTMR
jgi:hypothetical protein